MNEYYFKVIVWIVLFCLYIAMACYLYFVRIPNIQMRTSREIERDLQSMLLDNWPIIPENRSLEEGEYESLNEESFQESLGDLSRNIRSRRRPSTI